MTATHLKALHDIVDHASCLPARSEWERKAAAHAKIFGLLAEVADDPAMAAVLTGAARSMQGLMLAAGRRADGMTSSSRQRLQACLRAGTPMGQRSRWNSTSEACTSCGPSPTADVRRTNTTAGELLARGHWRGTRIKVACPGGPEAWPARTRDMCNTSRGGGE